MKLLLIDGYSLLYRAYFSSPPLTTKDGQPTGALYGFAKMVLRLLDEMQPEYALVAMDASGPTFRHDSYADYKAGRQEMTDDLRVQIGRAREMLEGFSVPHYEHVGFEADDILGTLSRMAVEQGLDVTIVTGDGDALQLVDDLTSVMLTRRGVSDLECYTPAAVQERYQFDAPLVPDYKGLRGDSSDNIPGVPGIGDKTAISLISKWGDLDAIYAHLDEVTPPRIRELLREHRDIAFESRQLARIVRDLPIEIDLEFCRYQMNEARTAQALETARRFQFRSLFARYGGDTPAASTLTINSRAAGSETQSTLDAASTVPSGERNFATQRFEEATKVLSWLQAAPQEAVAVLFDWGTEPVQVALARNDEVVFFEGDIHELGSWLSDDERGKIVHDAKTATLELSRLEIPLRGLRSDTLLMGYLLEPTRQQHPVSLLAQKYLSRALPVDADQPKRRGKAETKKAAASLFEDAAEAPKSPSDAESEAATAWHEQHIAVLTATAVAMLDLAPVLRERLEVIGAARLIDDIELPLVEVLVSMEQCGMLLDRQRLQEIGAQLETDAARLQGEIWELAGEEFNIGSTKKLQTILFDKLQLARGRAIKTGYSTDVHTLEKLAESHDIVRKILDFRGLTKLKSTYIDALLNGMDAQTQRVHTNLNQTGTVSGRLSSSDPNLQNVPIRTPQGRLIRQAFVAPPGHVLLAADYSQIELRILAHITGDAPLVEAFNSGQDVHSRTAAELFSIGIDQVDKEMRRKAKMTNYAIAYGVSGFGLAKQLGSGTAGEAQEFIRKYFETLPGVKRYIDETLQQARVDGWVQTLLGRRRPLPEITSPRAPERAAAERTAINHPIQGTSADAMKLAMLAVHRELRERGLKSRMTMQVHDELVFEVPQEEAETVAELVRRLMRDVPTQALGLRVPLEVDVEAGPNWDQTVGIGEDQDAGATDEVEAQDDMMEVD